MVRVINERNGNVFLTELHEARGLFRKFVGLMFQASLPTDQGLLFRPGNGIHTHFMRFPIDLVYLDELQRVSAIRAAMPPWRFDLRYGHAVIEANAGAAHAADLKVGDQLRFELPGGRRPEGQEPGAFSASPS